MPWPRSTSLNQAGRLVGLCPREVTLAPPVVQGALMGSQKWGEAYKSNFILLVAADWESQSTFSDTSGRFAPKTTGGIAKMDCLICMGMWS